jgi:hypothetical protein
MDTKQIDVDKLEAGPELDALIAQKVMGWILPPHSSIVGQMWVEPPMGRVHPEGPPPYSTDIAAAWQVVEKFNSWELQHNKWLISSSGRNPNQYSATLTRYKPEGFGAAVSTSMPLAICRAALKAVLK